MKCPCGSNKPFSNCCARLLQGQSHAESPEALMRSRYSAYATGNYQYILDTYAQQQKQTLSVEALAESDEGTSWLSLEVLRASGHTVEFLATYCADGQYFRMHELSSFVLEEDRWVYLSGDMLGQTGAFKPGRNDLCPCHSGKKFKKCCGRS